jgi:flagellar motor protein MotB
VLSAVGHGSTRPVVPTCDAVADAANRRIEISVSE